MIAPLSVPDAAEHHHDDQFARALPRHVGRADELGRVGEQEAGKPANRAGDHIGDELEAVDVEADRFAMRDADFRARRETTRPKREATSARQSR